MVQRQFPRWSDLKPYIGLRAPFSGPSAVESAATIADLRHIARRRTPTAVFDYVDGAAGAELSLNRSREAYGRIEFRPHVLRDVVDIDTSRQVLGETWRLPFGFGPTGFTRMMHHEGEPAVAQVAGEFGIPYTLSTLGTTSAEDLAAAAPDTRKWFQLYLLKEKQSRADLVRRVADSGYEAIMLTVDTVVAGSRLRDVRNGLTIPPQLTARTLAGLARYPRWWGNVLSTPPLEFASLRTTDGTVADLINNVFDPSVTMADVRWLREHWSGPLIIKGVQNVDDAMMLAHEGVDGILLSNHGGRQLDRSVVPLELLPEVRQAVGSEINIFVDGGVMSGADIVAAVAFGATGVFVGRAYLYGIMAGGEAGVRRVAQILQTEIEQTMRLMGVQRLEDITPDMVSFASS
ncbi:MAG: alpha-hydroxy acid oxidase [Actinomycetes bacterium]